MIIGLFFVSFSAFVLGSGWRGRAADDEGIEMVVMVNYSGLTVQEAEALVEHEPKLLVEANELQNIQPAVCAVFAERLWLVSKPEDIAKSCRKEVYRRMKAYKKSVHDRLIGSIPPNWIREDGKLVVQAVSVGGKRQLSRLRLSTIQVLFEGNGDACSAIMAESLEHMDHDQISVLNSACFDQIAWLDEKQFEEMRERLSKIAILRYDVL